MRQGKDITLLGNIGHDSPKIVTTLFEAFLDAVPAQGQEISVNSVPSAILGLFWNEHPRDLTRTERLE